MKFFCIGQRWISKMEPELGLGVVRELHPKTVLIHFPAADCQRHYAKDSAPLQRVQFKPGDTVTSKTGQKFTVEEIEEKEGLITYFNDQATLQESELCDTLSFSTPQDRLLSGLIDTSRAFNLRYQTLDHQHTIKKSPAHGFLGGRIDLLPHQLYIAHEVSRRLPRVLLCDEVGLGKTIEACLILHRLLVTGRVNRVLILVPESLIHQWFVELLRKFNLLFRLVNEDTFQSAQETDHETNPFFTDSLFLSSIEFLSDHKKQFKEAITADWDLLIVDEAHHLTEGSRSYQLVEALGKQTPGLILLTATPQQLGYHNHFARLRLLDPDRHHDFDAFQKEADQFQITARLADKLLEDKNLTKKEQGLLKQRIPNLTIPVKDKKQILQDLLDRHGMGRVMFRNTRSVVKGFPKRRVHLVPLEAQDQSLKILLEEFKNDVNDELKISCDYEDDPRLHWIAQWLKKDSREKVLLICKNIQKVEAINKALKNLIKVETALFHENLTLIQRDKNAAWFARRNGARILICSEIGSEGRNFQFAHHLILFDVPHNPELLEQRIGRLDRIGQKETINIHVPFVKGSPQEFLIHWYYQGLNAFESNLSDGYEILQQFGEQLQKQILEQRDIAPLIIKTSKAHKVLLQKMEKGRDRLLELHSFDPEVSSCIINEIQQWDSDNKSQRFITKLFAHFGIRMEEVADRTYRFHFELLENPEFPIPPLRESNLIGTFDRPTASLREDIEFLTWDHPMVTGAMELLLGSDKGNCAIALWPDSGSQAVLLETVFVLETVAPPELHCDRFLPSTPVRVLVDSQQKNKTNSYSSGETAKHLKDAPPLSSSVKSLINENLQPMMTACFETAQRESRVLIKNAEQKMNAALDGEISRLKELQKVNPDIREQEIQRLQKEKEALHQAIQSGRLRLDGVRLILQS